LTQAEAYREAYPKSREWKDESVWQRASLLSKNPNVQSRVQELTSKAAAANEVTVERVLKELARIAFGDARRVMAWGPEGVVLVESSELSDDDAAIVSEASHSITQSGRSVKVKTHDKLKALELLGRKLAMWTDRQEITGPDGKPLENITRIELVAPSGNTKT
jgi:phage terminase small subunit